MLYQDAFLQRLETGLRATLPKWGLPETAPVSLLTISENATYLVEDAIAAKSEEVHQANLNDMANIGIRIIKTKEIGPLVNR
jgi:hypothetical protein